MMAAACTAANGGAAAVASVGKQVAAKANDQWRGHSGHSFSVERVINGFERKKSTAETKVTRFFPKWE
jgi:hypothetical protein